MVGNRHIMSDKEDVLFHFGLSTASHDLRRMFSDVKVGSRSFALVFFSVICYRTHFRQLLLLDVSEIVISERETDRQTDRQTDTQREMICICMMMMMMMMMLLLLYVCCSLSAWGAVHHE